MSVPSPPLAKAKADPSHEELRIAIALNGGVSLAVWMGGCAVELDRARRGGEAGKGEEGRRVYDDLCECFGRRLGIDILTGTSAGGINGALLGAAIAKGRRLEPDFVRDRWIELGDLGGILHDAEEESPTALMDGKKFYEELLKAFKALLGTAEGSAVDYRQSPKYLKKQPLRSVPLLDVTMTDVIGVERRFRDAWGGELVARDHRPRFKFREREHFTPEALAMAARTSASFPFAFDPWLVAGDARVLAGLPNPTFGIDGGLLNNAPIRDALELIPTRPAASIVRRYFCYVNADPKAPEEETIGPPPTLPQVTAYAVGLPRAAPLVDHLYAIRDAIERPERAEKLQKQLLEMDLERLQATAADLFPSYADKRTLESLEELLPEPGDAKAMYELLEDAGGELPWIPRSWKPDAEKGWEWGLRPAQRVLYLLLDLLRPAIREAEEKKTRTALLETRIEIDRQLARLEGARDQVTQPGTASSSTRFEQESAMALVNEASARAIERAPEARAAVEAATEAFSRCVRKNRSLFPREAELALFGTTQPFCGDRRRARTFLRRALAIEVVRRAFATEADIESAAKMRFVQLTPEAPSPIFTSDPLNQHSPSSAAEKLTGVGLGHFAGFYRRSWRANDFMWGRLDAAVRIVDLLLDSPTQEVGTGASCKPAERIRLRAEELAAALLRNAGKDGAWLLKEVLEDGAASPRGDLRARLEKTISEELAAAEENPAEPLGRTKALFQRAAQLEVLREEVPVLVRESEEDRKRGSAARALELRTEGARSEDEGRVKALRAIYGGEESNSLPQRLTDEGEAVSQLGLQTITHAAFVALSALRTAGLPMSKFLGLARPPLLAVAGSVAKSRLNRATVALGYWAAALFLTSRLVTAEADGAVELSALWALPNVTAFVALLGVVGVVAVPGLRAWRRVHTARNLLFAILLALAAGGLATVLAIRDGGLDFERVLVAPGAEKPPENALWFVIGALGLASLARLPLLDPLKRFAKVLDALRRGRTMRLLLIAAFAFLGYDAGKTLIEALDDGSWQNIASLSALVAAPIFGACATVLWRSGSNASSS